MAKLDPFSAQIVEMVRRMPDEAILELVRGQLGVAAGSSEALADSSPASRSDASAARGGKATAAKKSAKKAKKKGGATKKRTTQARQEVLATVEQTVKASDGLSASEVAKATGIGQVRVATALRELKLAKRIFQGGDRRFARYAGDKKTAEAASLHARQTASGPIVKNKKRSRKSKSKSKSKRR